MRQSAPSRWVVVQQSVIASTTSKDRQSTHWRFPCALSELAPWHPQARHIDEQGSLHQSTSDCGDMLRMNRSSGTLLSPWILILNKYQHPQGPILIGNSVHYEYQTRLIQVATITQCVLVDSGLSLESTTTVMLQLRERPWAPLGGESLPHTDTALWGLRSKLHHSLAQFGLATAEKFLMSGPTH